jgi:hypothetical protein
MVIAPCVALLTTYGPLVVAKSSADASEAAASRSSHENTLGFACQSGLLWCREMHTILLGLNVLTLVGYCFERNCLDTTRGAMPKYKYDGVTRRLNLLARQIDRRSATIGVLDE